MILGFILWSAQASGIKIVQHSKIHIISHLISPTFHPTSAASLLFIFANTVYKTLAVALLLRSPPGIYWLEGRAGFVGEDELIQLRYWRGAYL